MMTAANPDRSLYSRIPALIAVCLAIALGLSASAAENVWSVQKLNDNKPWDRFVESPIGVRVEGRIGSFGGGQFRLLHCDAKFTVDNSKLKFVPPKSVVEVRGRFKKDGAKIEFAVDDIKVVSGYVEQFEVKASKLRRPTPEEWIELGDWMAERARIYDDEELRDKANDAYTSAIEVEYKSLKPTDSEGRFELAKKMNSYKLSSRRRMELIHEGLRIQWQADQKTVPPNRQESRKLLAALEQQLPGTTQPLKTVTALLKENYELDPVSTYRTADDKSRIQLHRLFFVAVTRKVLMHDASDDGRNGDSIADQIDKLIPEEHALAEKQRGLRLTYRLAHIDGATRAEAENLATKYQERQQIDNARQTLSQWIKSHESRLKGDGVVGLMQLADEYLSLLNDETTAVEFLKDAYKIDPTFEDAKAKLASLGYQWRGSAWIRSNGVQRDPSTSAAPLPTGINIGMTATDLRTLLGQPRSLARAITSRGITEIWSFGRADSSGLVVRLEQSGRDAEPKVKAASGR